MRHAIGEEVGIVPRTDRVSAFTQDDVDRLNNMPWWQLRNLADRIEVLLREKSGA